MSTLTGQVSGGGGGWGCGEKYASEILPLVDNSSKGRYVYVYIFTGEIFTVKPAQIIFVVDL